MGALTTFDGKPEVTTENETALDPDFDGPDAGEGQSEPEEPEEPEPREVVEKPEEPKEKPKKKGDWVPYERLESVARKNQELTRQNQQLTGKVDDLTKQFTEFKTALEEPEVPDAEEDPEAYRQWQLERVERDIQGLKAEKTRAQETQARSQLQQKVYATYQAAADRFAVDHSDFMPAYQHMMSRRTAGLREVGFSDDEIKQQVVGEEMTLVSKALIQGLDPAEAIYKIAVGTYGWTKSGAKSGPKAPKSIAGGGTTKGDLTEKDVDAMNKQEFAQHWATQRARSHPLRP